MEKAKSGFATAGLVLGIIGLCTSFIPLVNNLSFVFALIGILFCMVSLIKRASKGMAIAGAIVCILTCVAVVNSQQALSNSLNEVIDTFNDDMETISGDKMEEILANDVDVVLGDFEVTEGEWMTDTALMVKVTNKNSEMKSFSISIEAVAEDGSRIEQDTVYANNLNSGQSQDFKSFNLVSSDKIEALRNATFKILEVSMY